MKRTVSFDLFGESQYIFFDIPRLLEFEKAIGRSLAAGSFLTNPQLTLSETVIGLVISMKHYNRKAAADYYFEKISSYLEESGNGIEEIADLLLRAIVESGIYGKKAIDLVNGKTSEEGGETGKNE